MDVAGFYETVSHDRLAEILIEGTGRRPLVEALAEFLSRLMGADRGLPQGLTPSDPLAAAYLTRLDRTMLQLGFAYFRNGDDIRVAVPSYPAGRDAIAVAENALRAVGMTLNGAKTRILKLDTYEKQLRHIDEAKTELRQRLENLRLEQIRAGDQEALMRVAVDLGIQDDWPDDADPEDLVEMIAAETGDSGPYNLMSFEEQMDVLRPYITPDDVGLACRLLDETMAAAPHLGPNGLSDEEFHERVQDALLTIGAKADPCAVQHAAVLLAEYPADTDIVATYLGTLRVTHAQDVADEIERFATSEIFKHPWQYAWAFRLLLDFEVAVPEKVVQLAEWIANDRNSSPIALVAAVELLGDVGRLSQDLVMTLWRSSPPVLRPDIVAAAVRASRHETTWTPAFLEGCSGDRINEVVMTHLKYAPPAA